MKAISVICIVLLLINHVLGMNQGKGKKDKPPGQQGNKGNGNKGTFVTFYPCQSTLLKIERLVNGPPGKSKLWDGFLDLTSANGLSPLAVTIILDFPAKFQIVCN